MTRGGNISSAERIRGYYNFCDLKKNWKPNTKHNQMKNFSVMIRNLKQIPQLVSYMSELERVYEIIRSLDKGFSFAVRAHRNSYLRADELRAAKKFPTVDDIKFVYSKCLSTCSKFKKSSSKRKLSKNQALDYQDHLVNLFFLETVSQRKQTGTHLMVEVC